MIFVVEFDGHRRDLIERAVESAHVVERLNVTEDGKLAVAASVGCGGDIHAGLGLK